MTRVVEKPRGDKRIGSEYRHLAEALGLEGAFRMSVALTEADRSFRSRVYRTRTACGRLRSDLPVHHAPAEALGGVVLAGRWRSACGRSLA